MPAYPARRAVPFLAQEEDAGGRGPLRPPRSGRPPGGRAAGQQAARRHGRGRESLGRRGQVARPWPEPVYP